MTRAAAWLAALAVAANPGLLYLQATAMTEPLYLALFIWALVYFSEFAKLAIDGEGSRARAPLLRTGVLLAAAEMTRYDGWFTAAVFCVAVAVVWGAARRAGRSRGTREFAISMLWFCLIVSAALSLIRGL